MITKQERHVLHAIRRQTIKDILHILPEDKYDHYSSRIKTNESIQNKMRRKNSQFEDPYNILTDIIGIRIVTKYIDEIYQIVNLLKSNFMILESIDYIAHPKESGYRSYHVIIQVTLDESQPIGHRTFLPIEVQIRTMGMDFWASLEHSLVYDKKKHEQDPNAIALTHKELISYADDIFSIDMRLQALHHITESKP